MSKKQLLSNEEIASFCGQTALIIKAGIGPAEGMEILKQDTHDPKGQELLSGSAIPAEEAPASTRHFWKPVFSLIM